MSQPQWKYVANLGDCNPLEHGGYFVFIDETGVYDPEAEYLVLLETGKYRVYRILLEQCTFINGILSDNEFHPDFPAWFAQPESERKERPQDTTYLSEVAQTSGFDEEQLIVLFCSKDPLDLAVAYREVAKHHGWENFDETPLTLSRAEVEKRYKEILGYAELNNDSD